MLARSPLRKGVKPPDVYIGLFPWRADGSVYRLGLQPACWFLWQLFCRDGEHGRRALRDELGTVHCSLFFLSGLDAVCRRAGGGRVRGRNRIPDRTGQYAGDIETNTAFAKKACWYAIHQGHTPIAVHLLYPQMLDDAEPTEREIGLRLGHRVLEVCDELWLCGGRVSSGMAREIEEAQRLGIPIRQIGELEIKQEALPAEMEQSEAPGQSMGMA